MTFCGSSLDFDPRTLDNWGLKMWAYFKIKDPMLVSTQSFKDVKFKLGYTLLKTKKWNLKMMAPILQGFMFS